MFIKNDKTTCNNKGGQVIVFTKYFYGEKATMVRISKQAEKRSRSPRKSRAPSPKTGPLRDNLPNGYKQHDNALEGDLATTAFIPKIK